MAHNSSCSIRNHHSHLAGNIESLFVIFPITKNPSVFPITGPMILPIIGRSRTRGMFSNLGHEFNVVEETHGWAFCEFHFWASVEGKEEKEEPYS